MIPDDLPFDQISLLPEDWDDVEDGEVDLAGIRLGDLDDNAEMI